MRSSLNDGEEKIVYNEEKTELKRILNIQDNWKHSKTNTSVTGALATFLPILVRILNFLNNCFSLKH